ncbi:putative methylmalonate semialdehyde dehydrogenase, partial [Fasciolopsis buskii]
VAGVPHGVANVSHGAYQSVQFVCSHPLLRAVSFVGSDRAGRYLYETASENGKRVQCNMPISSSGQCSTIHEGFEPNVDVGPVISPYAKQRIQHLIESFVQEGAKILLDGRRVRGPGYEGGNFIGPTVQARVQSHMRCYWEKIFGPVRFCLEVNKYI